MFSTRNPWVRACANFLPSLQGRDQPVASPLVGEVGGGPVASAAEENLCWRHLLTQLTRPHPTLPTRGRAPALLAPLRTQRRIRTPLHPIALADAELGRPSATDLE